MKVQRDVASSKARQYLFLAKTPGRIHSRAHNYFFGKGTAAVELADSFISFFRFSPGLSPAEMKILGAAPAARACTPDQGLLTLAQRLNDEREVDKGDEHEIEFVEATEDAAEALEPSEQPLDLIAASI